MGSDNQEKKQETLLEFYNCHKFVILEYNKKLPALTCRKSTLVDY